MMCPLRREKIDKGRDKVPPLGGFGGGAFFYASVEGEEKGLSK